MSLKKRTDLRVLIIEDEVRLRKLLVRQLSAEVFEVWEAVDGKTGLPLRVKTPCDAMHPMSSARASAP